jgi:hypothetical protein
LSLFAHEEVLNSKHGTAQILLDFGPFNIDENHIIFCKQLTPIYTVQNLLAKTMEFEDPPTSKSGRVPIKHF